MQDRHFHSRIATGSVALNNDLT